MDKTFIAERTVEIVSAFVAGNMIDHSKMGALIADVAKAIGAIGEEPVEEAMPEPAVHPSRSIKRDYLISLIDGKPYKMLKRHLSNHRMTPEDYGRAFGLPSDYPMVAPAYAEERRKIAIANGFGRKAAS